MLQRLSAKFRKKKKNRPTLETDATPDYGRTSAVERELSRSESRLSELRERNNQVIPAVSDNNNPFCAPVQGPISQPVLVTPQHFIPPQLSACSSTPNSFLGCSPHIPPVSIVITNASGFHVGDTINFSVSDNASVNLSTATAGLGLSNLGQSLTKKLTKSQEIAPDLEEIVDVICDKEMAVIAQNLTDWKAFGKALTIFDTDIEQSERKFPARPIDAAQDMLRSFVNLYPDTSVGFIAAALKESAETNALRCLTKLRS